MEDKPIDDAVAALEERMAARTVNTATVEPEVTEGEATTPAVTEDPESGLTLIGARNNREYPIRNIKLLTSAREGFKSAREAEAELSATALTLFGIVATASDLFKRAQTTELEWERLKQRLIADSDGKVKAEDVLGVDFKRAVFVLKPKA